MKTPLLSGLSALLLGVSLFSTPKAFGHCDAVDGPVVEAAKIALQTGEVAPVLKWVSADREKEIREVFAAALKVRKLGDEAKALADTHFFETLVRVHRAGEGVPFSGLKPAGTIDPGFVAADKALRDGSIEGLSTDLAKAVQAGLQKRFARVTEKKNHADDSVEAGRDYVAAYVDYAHFVEAIHTATSRTVDQPHHLHASDRAEK